jgi:hypothetical protein
MVGPRYVSEAEMAPTECARWGMCAVLVTMGATAIDPCSSCAATAAGSDLQIGTWIQVRTLLKAETAEGSADRNGWAP